MSYPQKMDTMNIPSMMCTSVKQTRRRFQSNNNNTFTGSGVDINIPISGEFSIDNKNVNLNFKLTVATAACQADFSLFGLFKTIRVLNANKFKAKRMFPNNNIQCDQPSILQKLPKA